MTKDKKLSWQEIKERYPDQWVGLTDVEWRNQSNIAYAVVKYSDLSANELLKRQFGDEPDLVSSYTTPDNVAYVGVIG